ncbi:hypothetical protein KJ966_24555 [bacterium]|nr:hypothetical protein [bacterium]
MSQVPDAIWAIDIKWDAVTLGPKLNDTEDDFEYVYNEEAVKQVIYLAIRDSDNTQTLINAHPTDVLKRLNKLKEEIEDKEWSIVLGSISLKVDYETKQLIFNGLIEGQEMQSVRVALDLTKEDESL